jgi:hypothetical protein
MEKFITIKLLHRTKLTKKILIENVEKRNSDWWFYTDIQIICDILNIEPDEVCFYPEKTRRKLK